MKSRGICYIKAYISPRATLGLDFLFANNGANKKSRVSSDASREMIVGGYGKSVATLEAAERAIKAVT